MQLVVHNFFRSQRESLTFAAQALRGWGARQVLTSVITAVSVVLVIGFVTVLIPNDVFSRDIPPVWWNWPVLLLTAAMSGVLIGTYVRERSTPAAEAPAPAADTVARSDRRSGRLGVAGGLLIWFAVGCPVCNKLALLALGYSGAITWFAPFQPVLAVVALVATGIALVARLRGQVACPVSRRRARLAA